ncbi:MAG: tRNA (adenosine(37)-N6)-threonylcarbamoyltransferase complex transferase subunit TsaD [Candidatus Pacebacteria bacterium]|nr:tRNA (adenosine(37)-N6)-threonylcarbamoyltransferase complex transferase subunit TsaD [Candidatus Paceibacterota bacterium]
MKILSIESSCDDTGITIFEAKGGVTNASFKILSDNLASQTIHAEYGGVFPVLAKKEHAKNLPLLLEHALKKTKLDKKTKPVDAIAVTYGPGLEMCLWEGITFARDLAKKWDVPVIPTNHMEGHILSIFGKHKGSFKVEKLKLPILALLVSGGHTQLVLMKKWMQYEIIGETVDDAVGEAFDKVARMLGLPYPGGPHISKLAEELRSSQERGLASTTVRARANFQQKIMGAESVRTSEFSLPRPMMYTKDFNFSYSGLKTAVLYLIRDLEKSGKKIDDKIKSQIALEFENAAIECITHKVKKVIEKYGIKTVIIGGGVAANKHLRNEMKKLIGKKIKLLLPTFELSRDNSVMIGIAGYLNYIKNKKKTPKPETIKATGNLRV